MKYWIHLNSNSFVFKKEEALDKPETSGDRLISVTKDVYDRIVVGFQYNNGEWIEASEIAEVSNDPVKERINELKSKLRDTDWVVVEILEAQLGKKDPEHNFDEIYDKRQAWRREIAQLILASEEQK